MTTQSNAATPQSSAAAPGTTDSKETGSAEAAKTADATTQTPAKADVSQPTKTEDKATAKPADPAKANEGTEAELTFTFPEGVAPDKDVLAAVTPVFKELGLKSEGAQKLVSAYLAAQGESISKHLAKQNEEWKAQARADSEIGGDKFEATVANAQRVFKEFGDPEVSKLLEESGFGNHPAFLRLWNKVARAVADDSVAGTAASGGNAPRTGDEALSESMYTHPTSQKYLKEK